MDCSTKESNEPEKKEEERTLTDHLNKKLLESFLQRIDGGEFNTYLNPAEENGEQEWKESGSK